MIGDDARDFKREFAGTPAPQQVGQTMAQLANHQHNPRTRFSGAQGPLRLQLHAHRSECVTQLF